MSIKELKNKILKNHSINIRMPWAKNAASKEVSLAKPSKKKILLAAAAAAACLFAILIGVYFFYGYKHRKEFFKGTTINGMEVSGMTVPEVEKILSDSVKTYHLSVTDQDGQTCEIDASDIDYRYVSDGSIQGILDKQVWWQWAKSYLSSGRGDHQTTISIDYDREKLRKIMNSWSFMQKENQTAPVDSALSYEDGKYVVSKHVDGNTIADDKLFQALKDAIDNNRVSLSVEDADAYVRPAVTENDPILTDNARILNEQANCTITHNMPDGTTKVIDAEMLLGWMSTDADGRYHRDDTVFQEKIAAWVQELSEAVSACNGTNVTFISSNPNNPRQVSVRSYLSGSWSLDPEEETRQLTEEIMSNTTTTREPIYRSRRFVGSGSLGDTYVEIDLSAQHLWYYKNGELLLQTDIVSGTYTNESRRTPAGVYNVYYKQRNRTLRGPATQEIVEVQVPVEVTVPGTDPILDANGNVIQEGTPPTTRIEYKTEQRIETKYEYEQPVDYWMPFNGGIGLHDAGWRPSFGGNIYMYSGSHGCINMPHDIAGQLFENIEKGCTVVCYY